MLHRVNNVIHTVFSARLPYLGGILLLIALGTGLSTCKKETGFDSSTVTLDQMKGTWRGRITTMKSTEVVEKNGDVSFYLNPTGNLLDGIFDLGQVNFLKGFMFQNGTIYFNLVLSDTTNPLCSDWNLSGYAFLQEPNLMVIRIAGRECGKQGKQFVTYEGNLILINPEMDPSIYFSFAAVGRSWTYETRLFSGATCLVQQDITEETSPYLFTYKEINSCGWTYGTRHFKRFVDPFRFSEMDGNSSTEIQYSFFLDAVKNKTYQFIDNEDTTSLTLLDTKVQVDVPAGSFKCNKYWIDSRRYVSGYVKTTGVLFLNKQYGFIKVIYNEPNDTLDIRDMSLLYMNF